MTQASITFSANTAEVSAANDTEFLKAIEWERGADAAMRTAATAGDVNAFVAAWQQRVRKTGGQTPAFSATILWSQAAFPDEAELVPLLEEAAGVPSKPHKGPRRTANKTTRNFAQRVESLVYALTGEPQTVQTANAAFALAASMELLANAEGRLRNQQVWRLWRYSLIQAIHLTRNLPTEVDPTLPADIELLERGEIPYVAGLVFEGIVGASQLVKTGKKALARELVDSTDTDGTPHADLVERLPLWLAPLIRVTRIARGFNVRLWTRDQEELLKSVVERAIPLCRPDGRAALSNGLKLQPLPVLNAAAETCGLAELGSVGSYLRSVKRVVDGKSPARPRNDGVISMPSNQSDFARFALLRSDWTVQADSVALAHHRRFPQLDVTASGRPLIHGDWTIHLAIGGSAVELADEWSCVCWQSDPDADYIELQMQGPGKLRVERIVMLSRTQRFLLLADSISGVPKSRIQYQSQLPLGENVQPKQDTATREIQLSMKGFRARAFPLALPQDRIMSTPHEFTGVDGHLTLNQVAEGEGLFAPVLLDWDPGRSRGAAQWRSLTVTEDGRVIGGDIAAGHRLKINDLQLLIFRSLKSTGHSRAVLGHHTWNETVVARVDKKGDVDPILSVES
ncbi:MAG: hypothetical protein JSS49_08050 [Planctomycetes bacterium]|nr:hypothetical protein [Planctomycetota bacterium]